MDLRRHLAALVALVALVGACATDPPLPGAQPDTPAADSEAPTDDAGGEHAGTPPDTDDPPPDRAPEASPAPEPQLTPQASPTPEPVTTEVPVRIENWTEGDATASFATETMAILTDPRGWVRAEFVFTESTDAPYRIILAEGPEVDELCAPYRTGGRYSCQNGPIVALNADRWREATPQWPADLDSYRIMLVNHEVGHLLHLHHPDPQCPGPGLPAPVMTQQSTTLGDCAPNPWPLEWEIVLAAERREPLAPPADHDVSDHRPVPPPAQR